MRWDFPVALVKMGHYPLHHGGLWIARSLGRAGVPVYAMTESAVTPLAQSRYVTRIGPPLDPGATDAANHRSLQAALSRIACPVVAIATDDEAAVWLAEQRPAGCVLPDLDPGLPRALADKWSLHEMCAVYGVSSPVTIVPVSRADLDDSSRRLRFPVVLKNSEAFARVTAPAVTSTIVMQNAGELQAWANEHFRPDRPPLVQEFASGDVAQKWSYQAYRSARVLTSFTGLKKRDYPLHRGEATYVESLPNPDVSELGDHFLQSVGYAGMADLDFVFDSRERIYRLIDFNPRVGAIAAMCGTDDGLDLPRIAYLDLTGQQVHPGPQVDHRSFVVETNDGLARAELGLADEPVTAICAYFAEDDRRPAMVVKARRAVSRMRARLAS